MRLTAAVASAIFSSALLAGSAYAQDESAAESSTTVPKPTFTVRSVRHLLDLLMLNSAAYQPPSPFSRTVHG